MGAAERSGGTAKARRPDCQAKLINSDPVSSADHFRFTTPALFPVLSPWLIRPRTPLSSADLRTTQTLARCGEGGGSFYGRLCNAHMVEKTENKQSQEEAEPQVGWG